MDELKVFIENEEYIMITYGWYRSGTVIVHGSNYLCLPSFEIRVLWWRNVEGNAFEVRTTVTSYRGGTVMLKKTPDRFFRIK